MSAMWNYRCRKCGESASIVMSVEEVSGRLALIRSGEFRCTVCGHRDDFAKVETARVA